MKRPANPLTRPQTCSLGRNPGPGRGDAGATPGMKTLASEATPSRHEHSAVLQTHRVPAPVRHQYRGPPPRLSSQTPAVPSDALDGTQLSAACISSKAGPQAATFAKGRPSVTRDGVGCVGAAPVFGCSPGHSGCGHRAAQADGLNRPGREGGPRWDRHPYEELRGPGLTLPPPSRDEQLGPETEADAVQRPPQSRVPIRPASDVCAQRPFPLPARGQECFAPATERPVRWHCRPTRTHGGRGCSCRVSTASRCRTPLPRPPPMISRLTSKELK